MDLTFAFVTCFFRYKPWKKSYLPKETPVIQTILLAEYLEIRQALIEDVKFCYLDEIQLVIPKDKTELESHLYNHIKNIIKRN